MEFIGLWVMAAGLILALGSLIFWCTGKYVPAKTEKVVTFIFSVGCLAMVVGGCIELYILGKL